MAVGLEIAIVGCGPSGMAAALLLARAGHRVRIFERFAAPRPVGAGLLLQPTGLAVLAHLGLGETIAAAGARIDRLDGRVSPSGRRILDVAYADLAPDIHGVGIHRASLFDALHGALAGSDAAIEPSTPVAALEAASDGRPCLVTETGRRLGPFDLAIDASGSQSPLRVPLGGRKAAAFAYGALWTTLPLAGHGFDRAALAQRYVAARHMVGVMPVGRAPGADGDHAAFFWSIRADAVGAWQTRGLAAWKAEVAAIWPEAAAFVAGVDDAQALTPAFYRHFTARRPTGARIALVGDAAHSTSPQLGQGANMGLLDAAALAAALARHPDMADALAAYAATRRRHVRFYQRASYWLTPLFQSDGAVAAAVRDFGFAPLARLPYFRQETVRTLAGLKTGLLTRASAARLASQTLGGD